MFLKEHHIESYIKLQEHEQRKTRAYKEQIGKYYNMELQVFEDEHYYICHDGRELRRLRTETKEKKVISKRWKCTAVQIAVAASIKRNAFTDIIREKGCR